MQGETRTSEQEWVNACKDAIGNLDYFRLSPAFQRVVEGTPTPWGRFHLTKLINRDLFVNALDDLEQMDLLGMKSRNSSYDKRVEFKVQNSDGTRNHCLTPTALRYARNTINILDIFSKDCSSPISVYEIGGGYGGDAKTFGAIASRANISVHSWNVFDLESSFELIRESCKNIPFPLTLNANFPSDEITPKGKSLCFSCGALSEMNGKTLDSYLSNVVISCDYGYFLCNFDSHSKPYGGITTDDFIKFLVNSGKSNVQELNPFEYFTPYDKYCGGSRLVIFGATELLPSASPTSDFIRFKSLRLRDKISKGIRGFIAG